MCWSFITRPIPPTASIVRWLKLRTTVVATATRAARIHRRPRRADARLAAAVGAEVLGGEEAAPVVGDPPVGVVQHLVVGDAEELGVDERPRLRAHERRLRVDVVGRHGGALGGGRRRLGAEVGELVEVGAGALILDPRLDERDARVADDARERGEVELVGGDVVVEEPDELVRGGGGGREDTLPVQRLHPLHRRHELALGARRQRQRRLRRRAPPSTVAPCAGVEDVDAEPQVGVRLACRLSRAKSAAAPRAATCRASMPCPRTAARSRPAPRRRRSASATQGSWAPPRPTRAGRGRGAGRAPPPPPP